MGNAVGWKIATGVLSLVVAVLSAALFARPAGAPNIAIAGTSQRDASDATPQKHERRRVTPAAAQPDEDLVAEPVVAEVTDAPNESATTHEARLRAELAGMTLEDVCRRELLLGGRAPAPLVVERLLLERARAAELMTTMFANRTDPRWRELGIKLAPHFNATYVQVGGDAAATQLRALLAVAFEEQYLVPLLRYGDETALRLLDEEQRKQHPRRFVNAYLLARLGEPTRRVLYGWINDSTVPRSVRLGALGGLWVAGTPQDRQRLWRESDDVVRVTHFPPHAVRDDNDWGQQICGRVEAMLVDPDPWVRLHGARSAMKNRFLWGDALAFRAADIASAAATLPMPDGRDGFEWKELLRWISIHRQQLPAAPPDEAAVREALGLR